MTTAVPGSQVQRFEPQPSQSGRGLKFGLSLSALAIVWSIYRFATGHSGDPLTWITAGVGVLMVVIAILSSRTDTTPLTFIVGPDYIARDQPEKTAFQLGWAEISAAELVHEHFNNTFWFEFRPTKVKLYERNPAILFYKVKGEDDADEIYRVLVNDGTDQMEAVHAALVACGRRRYRGQRSVTIKEDQDRRKKNRSFLKDKRAAKKTSR